MYHFGENHFAFGAAAVRPTIGLGDRLPAGVVMMILTYRQAPMGQRKPE